VRALLDVNVLLALMDEEHRHHSRAHAWLETADAGWATCAITEIGMVRIVSQPAYPHPLTTDDAVELLTDACGGRGHEYWPCDVSLRDAVRIDRVNLISHKQVTDTYLLALAVAHGGRFVTFDKGVSLATVPGVAPENLIVL
jgi:toxin-antitoxin system PIN domain toxin